MNNLKVNNLKIEEQIFTPYPIIIYSNFLDNNQLNILKDSLKRKDTNFDKNVMGGRKIIFKGSYNFEKYSNNNKIAAEIVNFFDDTSVFSFFYKNLNNLKKKNPNYFNLENENFKFFKDYINRKNSFFFRIKNKFLKNFSILNKNCCIYCDLDFSVAGKGYEREPHHDRDDRVLNFLFYINSYKNGNGGNFQIFKYKSEPRNYLRQPLLNDLNIIKEIKPTAGLLITFFSYPNSIHGVEKIISNDEQRYFLYGSYTTINKTKWIKN